MLKTWLKRDIWHEIIPNIGLKTQKIGVFFVKKYEKTPTFS